MIQLRKLQNEKGETILLSVQSDTGNYSDTLETISKFIIDITAKELPQCEECGGEGYLEQLSPPESGTCKSCNGTGIDNPYTRYNME